MHLTTSVDEQNSTTVSEEKSTFVQWDRATFKYQPNRKIPQYCTQENLHDDKLQCRKVVKNTERTNEEFGYLCVSQLRQKQENSFSKIFDTKAKDCTTKPWKLLYNKETQDTKPKTFPLSLQFQEQQATINYVHYTTTSVTKPGKLPKRLLYCYDRPCSTHGVTFKLFSDKERRGKRTE